MRRVSEILKPLCVTSSFFSNSKLDKAFFEVLIFSGLSRHDCEKGEMFPILVDYPRKLFLSSLEEVEGFGNVELFQPCRITQPSMTE